VGIEFRYFYPEESVCLARKKCPRKIRSIPTLIEVREVLQGLGVETLSQNILGSSYASRPRDGRRNTKEHCKREAFDTSSLF